MADEKDPKTVKTYFESKNLEVIDMRPKGGCLWVIGDQQKLKPYLDEVASLFQVEGRFAEGKATRYRVGWYTKTNN